MNRELFRIIDANLNRSREGLRVCEEIARFVLSSQTLTRDLKSARHAISDIARLVPEDGKPLHVSRDVLKDVGRRLDIPDKMLRSSLTDVWKANIQRTKESIRVLEEFFQLIDKRASARLMELRFDIYDIEKKASFKIEALSSPRKAKV